MAAAPGRFLRPRAPALPRPPLRTLRSSVTAAPDPPACASVPHRRLSRRRSWRRQPPAPGRLPFRLGRSLVVTVCHVISGCVGHGVRLAALASSRARTPRRRLRPARSVEVLEVGERRAGRRAAGSAPARAVEDRRARRVGAALLFDQAALLQGRQRPLRRDPAHLGDLGARGRLQVRDHGERLDQGRRQGLGRARAGVALARALAVARPRRRCSRRQPRAARGRGGPARTRSPGPTGPPRGRARRARRRRPAGPAATGCGEMKMTASRRRAAASIDRPERGVVRRMLPHGGERVMLAAAGLVGARDRDVGERSRLVEHDLAAVVQLEQGEERDGLLEAVARRDGRERELALVEASRVRRRRSSPTSDTARSVMWLTSGTGGSRSSGAERVGERAPAAAPPARCAGAGSAAGTGALR